MSMSVEWTGEISVPEEVLEIASKYRDTVLFMGALSYHGHPEYAEKLWEQSSEDLRDRMLRAGVLREFLKTGDEMERTYSNAFFMTHDIDLRLE